MVIGYGKEPGREKSVAEEFVVVLLLLLLLLLLDDELLVLELRDERSCPSKLELVQILTRKRVCAHVHWKLEFDLSDPPFSSADSVVLVDVRYMLRSKYM